MTKNDAESTAAEGQTVGSGRAKARRWRVALLTEAVRRCGVLSVLAELRQRRPSELTSEGFLVILALIVADKRPLLMTELIDLAKSLPKRAKMKFGVTSILSRVNGEDALSNAFYERWESLGRALNHHPVSRPFLLPEHRQGVPDLRVRVCDALAAGFLAADLLALCDSHVQDASAVDSAGNRKNGGDPQARVGYKTPTDADPSSRYFGFEPVCLGCVFLKFESSLYLIAKHETVTSTADEGVVGVRILRRRAAASKLGYVVTDRLAPYSRRYLPGVLELGGIAVVDLHPDLLGQHGTYAGGVWVDNALLCPGFERDYANLPYVGSDTPMGRAVRAAGHHRELFAAQQLDPATPRGGLHALCPFWAGLVGCAVHKLVAGLPSVPHPPTGSPLPEICTRQDGVVIPLLDDSGEPTWPGRTFSPVVRLGELWFEIYSRLRGAVENGFATLTTVRGANLRKGQHLAVGLAQVALIVAVAIGFQNLDRLRKWWRAYGRTEPNLPPPVRDSLAADPLLADKAWLHDHYDTLFPR